MFPSLSCLLWIPMASPRVSGCLGNPESPVKGKLIIWGGEQGRIKTSKMCTELALANISLLPTQSTTFLYFPGSREGRSKFVIFILTSHHLNRSDVSSTFPCSESQDGKDSFFRSMHVRRGWEIRPPSQNAVPASLAL